MRRRSYAPSEEVAPCRGFASTATYLTHSTHVFASSNQRGSALLSSVWMRTDCSDSSRFGRFELGKKRARATSSRLSSSISSSGASGFKSNTVLLSQRKWSED